MKRIIFIIALLASARCGMWAQDTLWQRPAPLKNYFSNVWVDTNNYGCGTFLGSGAAEISAQQFITDDTLQIYGIAAMMVHSYSLTPPEWFDGFPSIQEQLNHYYPEDPTFDHLDEWLLLFQYHGPDAAATMDQLGDSLFVSYNQTPTYYFLSYRQPLGCYADTMPKPVYERYFTEPQTVHDTFFAGFTQGQYRYNGGYWIEYRPFFCAAYFNNYPSIPIADLAFMKRDTPESSPSWIFFRNYTMAYFIFPILTPDSNAFGGDTVIVNPNDTTGVNPGDTTIVNPGDTIVLGNDTIAMGDTLIVSDTTIIGGDTIVNYDTILSIVQADLLQRFTGVMPNPAAEKARVVSSFGMSMVKVYNASGALVHTQRADGLYVDLDVSRWPAGTYLVRIHTPQGIATKRLVVSR